MEADRARCEKQRSQNFAREVKERVNDYFEQNRLSRNANAAMITKTVVLVALYFGSYGLIISGLLPLPWMWFFCFVMGIGMAGIGFSVTHDALHGAYSANPRVNRLIGCFFDTHGANGYVWKSARCPASSASDREARPKADSRAGCRWRSGAGGLNAAPAAPSCDSRRRIRGRRRPGSRSPPPRRGA